MPNEQVAQVGADTREGHAQVEHAQIESVPWHSSLRTRLVVLTSLCGVLLLLGVSLLIYAGARRVVIEQSRHEIHGLAEQTALGLEATMNSVAVSAVTLTASVQGIGFDPRHLRALLQATVRGDPDIAGAMLILEPDALRAGNPEFSWYARLESDGFYEQPMRYPGYDYHVQPWWRRTVRDGRTWWSEPYKNKATGGVLFVTYNHPIRDNDNQRVVGMVSLDVPVQRLRDLVGASAHREAMFAVLLSPEHRFVIHPDHQIELNYTFEDIARIERMAGLRALLQPLNEARAAETVYTDVSNTPRLALLQPVGKTGWTLGLSATDEYVLRRLKRATWNVVAFGTLATLAAVLGLRLVARRVTDPILGLTASASHFVVGEFDRPLPHTQRADEVGVMARAFDHARGSIKAQLQRIEQMGAARQKLESELSIARDIQLAMVPPAPTLERGARRLATHAALEPARAVGGDFYTFLARDDHTLWFAIGDVSDKGVPAALFMARTITMLEVAAGMGGPPDRALRIAARRLIEGNDTCMFATVLCGVVDVTTGGIVLASAGHEAPVLLHADGRAEFVPLETAAPLGFEVAEHYPVWNGQLHPGDALIAYTDGITEAFNAQQQAFGAERLLAALTPGADAHVLCQSLIAAAHRFADGAEQSDDITVLALSFTSFVQEGSMRFRIEIPNERARLHDLLAAIDDALAGNAVCVEIRDDLRLITEEVVSNSMDHGAASDGATEQHQISVDIARHEDELHIEFRDTGKPFDPLALPPPALDDDILDRPIGGLGVHLVRELAKSVSYARVEPHNVLHVVLRTT